MSVHSVRLPDALWRRLNDALATANAERRRPIARSTLLRALLERSLNDPTGLPDLEGKVLRPGRLLPQETALKAETEVSAPGVLQGAEHENIYKAFHHRLKHYMREESISPNRIFSEALSYTGDTNLKTSELRRPAMQYIHSGFFPENCNQDFIIGRLRDWLDKQTT